jgi:MFS family permease
MAAPPTTASSKAERQHRRDFVIWRVCAWSGVVYVAGAIVFWAIIAGFIPPPRQNWTAEQVATYYADNQTRIRLGMEGILLVGFFYALFAVGLARLMQRVEGERGFLHQIQLMGGLATAMITFGCALAWLTATLRAGERDPGDVQTLNDLGWMIFDMTALVTIAQMVAFGVTWLLEDDRPEPLFPRWIGYLSFWMGATFLVVFVMPWMTSGPFAWQGLITLYVGFGAFFVWMGAVLPLMFRAIRRVEIEDRAALAATGSGDHAPQVDPA